MSTANRSDANQPIHQTDSLERLGYPTGFKVGHGTTRPPFLGGDGGQAEVLVEARQLEGHQKEAVVTEGQAGSAWRMATDEDGHLRGTDLAPFPLGFFNAGLHADLTGRIQALATERQLDIGDLTLGLDTGYWMTGSFFKGTAEGFAEPARIKPRFVGSPTDPAMLRQLVDDAVEASPALAAMRRVVPATFALYVNGRRREVTSLPASAAADAVDPFTRYSQAPAPLTDAGTLPGLIDKTGEKVAGTPEVAPGEMKTRQIRPVIGVSRSAGVAGSADVDVVLGMKGASHFRLQSDDRARAEPELAPCGLSLLMAGIGFCYMTQLSRYITYQKMGIRGVRLVQSSPIRIDRVDGAPVGTVESLDTHLFLSGDEDDETFERLMTIAATTCYLHATLAAELEPEVTIDAS